jgi:hypothetical protein
MPTVKKQRFSLLNPLGWLYLLGRTLFRYFVTGQSVTGRKTDNASFLHAATKDDRGKPVERLSGPIWQRLARRWAALGLPALFTAFAGVSYVARFLTSAFGVKTPTFFALPWLYIAIGWEVAMLCGLAGFGSTMLYAWWRTREQVNEFVRPAWQAACTIMGTPYHRRDARSHVELPEGFEVVDRKGADEPTRLGRIADRLFRDRRQRAALARAERAAVQRDEGGIETPPGTEIAVQRSPMLARWRGRQLDESPQAPAESPEPPPVRVFLVPGRVTAEQDRKRFTVAVGSVLGMPDAKATWYARGRKPYVELRPNLAPPPAVSFEQVRKHIVKAPLTAPFMGLAPGNHAVSIDLDNNSPHTMISGGSGTGKSVLLKNFAAQRMHNGAASVMLDYKRVSHRWMHNLPGCVYAWRLADIHANLCAAGEELGRRLETVLPPDDDINAEMQQFPTVDIYVEEINSTTTLLQAYWNTVLGGQGKSPAITALMTLVNMGREYRMHVWIAAQRASASVFGANGGDLRESFQTRLMAKWTVQTWKMLAGNAQYRRPIGGRGVWARVQDDEVEIVRVPFWTNAEAREWAMSGEPCPGSPLPGGAHPVGGDALAASPDIEPQLVTLSGALPQLPPDKRGNRLSIDGLRTASRRDGFPAPRVVGGKTRPSLYDLDELIEWRIGKVGVDELTEMFDQPAALRDLPRPGRIYVFDTLDPESGQIECGYVGQTRRTLAEREAEHRGNQPWADLIVGNARLVWEGEPTDDELDAIEKQYTNRLRPRYSIEYQNGAPWVTPKRLAVKQRHARDRELGRLPWVPVDVYNGESRPELVEDFSRDEK